MIKIQAIGHRLFLRISLPVSAWIPPALVGDNIPIDQRRCYGRGDAVDERMGGEHMRRKRRTKSDRAGEAASRRDGPLRGLQEKKYVKPRLFREHSKKRLIPPGHGIRLDIAENELRTRQCPRRRRLGGTLQASISAWSVGVDERQRGVDRKT